MTSRLATSTVPCSVATKIRSRTATASIIQAIFNDDADREPVTIRINGIDAPEIGQRFGQEAKTFLSKQLLGHEVDVAASGTDRYQRMLADVSRKMQPDRFRADKSPGTFNASKEMVRNGLAWHYVKYSDDIELAKLQNLARSERLGLWQDASRVAPWDYRNGQRIATGLPQNVESIRTTDEIVYVTKGGTKYHCAGCRYLSKSMIEIPLSRAGAYEPCSKCNP